jgi:fluoroacetyl-CoA thioesterase
MKRKAKIGEIGKLTFTVTKRHVIDFADDQMPEILSTPWLIWFLEHAGREAMLTMLEPHESTVGVSVDVKHTAPTPIGHKVTCTARIINTDGRLITFQIEARDEHEKVAYGLHKLRVIDAARLREKVERKQGR